MFYSPLFEILLPTALLIVAVIDDLRSQKIHNKLILFLLPIVLISIFLLKGLSGLKIGLISALLAFVIGVPLKLGRFIGGGDFKILVLFALTVDWLTLSYSFFYALPWALLLGIFKIALDKKLKDFFSNLFLILLFKFKGINSENLHTIPFSVALLLGWLSYCSLNGKFYGLF